MPRPLLDTPTLTASGATVGRKRKEAPDGALRAPNLHCPTCSCSGADLPPDGAAEVIEAAVADGFSIVGVAMRFGTTREVLQRWMSEHPALDEAFKRGREHERYACHNRVRRIGAESPDERTALLANFYILNTKHGYRETEAEGNRLNVTFNLPGALPLDQFIKHVNDDAST